MQHGRYQNRQLVPRRLTLPRQPLGQLRLNPFRPTRDHVDLCHRSIPCRKPHGSGASHQLQPVNLSSRKTDGWGGYGDGYRARRVTMTWKKALAAAAVAVIGTVSGHYALAGIN